MRQSAGRVFTVASALMVALAGCGGDDDDSSGSTITYGAVLSVTGDLANIGNEAVLAKALFVFGRYKAETGEHADAKDMLRDALMMFSRLGLERPASEVEKLLASMN